MHTAPQTRGKGIRVPAENVHDGGPGHAGEDGPCVVGDCGAGFGSDEGGEGVHVGLDGELGEGEHHAREDVDDDLVLFSIDNSLGWHRVYSFASNIHHNGGVFVPAG